MNADQFIVSDSLENARGDNGWDCEEYGPFATEEAAVDFAKRVASEGYHAHDDERRIVEVRQNGSNYGGTPRHGLFSWRSDDDDENTVHTCGPSDAEKKSLLIRDEVAEDADDEG